MNIFETVGVRGDLRPSDKVVQLVKHREQVPASKLTFPQYGQIKKDGVYCMLLVTATGILSFSRTGKRFKNCEYFHEIIDSCMRASGDRCVGDVIISELCNEHFSLEELSGLVNPNRTKPITEEEADKLRDSEFFLHDLIDSYELMHGISGCTYRGRFEELRSKYSDLEGCTVLPVITLHSEEEVQKYADLAITEGEEGVVLKNPNTNWVAGRRGAEMTKIVRGVHYDLEVVGVEEGKKGKRLEMTGNLLCRWRMYGKSDGEEVIIPVDGKYTDDQRIQWFLQPHLVVGKILHVKALQLGSKGLLRLPKGQELRVDKDKADF